MMAAATCPGCRGEIPASDLNMTEGVGLCRGCDRLWRLAQLVGGPSVDGSSGDEALPADLNPPGGCSVKELGDGRVFSSSCRGGPGGFFLIFALFWNSVISIFVITAAASLYEHIIGPPPSWFPFTQSTQLEDGGSDAGSMPLGMTIGLCVFLIPFVLIGGVTATLAVVSLVGRNEVTVRGGRGEVFTGVGPIGWRRRFDARAVQSVRMREAGSTTNGRRDKQIVIEADRTVKVGVLLSERRRTWLCAVLQRELGGKKGLRRAND